MKILRAALTACLLVVVGCGGGKGGAASGPTTPAEGTAAAPTEPAAPAPAEPAAAAPAEPAAPAAPAAEAPAAAAPAAPAAPTEPAAPAASAGKTASGLDLKVLPASWTKDQVKDYMKKTVSAGLGVKCDFCHDVSNFAADTEKKTIARGMIKMAGELNKQYFNGQQRLGCVTCHNGNSKPKSE